MTNKDFIEELSKICSDPEFDNMMKREREKKFRKKILPVVCIAGVLIICAAVCAGALGVFSINAGTTPTPVYTLNPLTGEIPTALPSGDSQPSLYDIQYNDLKKNGYDVCIVFRTYTEADVVLSCTYHSIAVLCLNDYDYEIDSELFSRYDINGQRKSYPYFESGLLDRLSGHEEPFTDAEINVIKNGEIYTSIHLSFDYIINADSDFRMLEVISAESDKLKVKFVNLDMMSGETW